METEPVSPQEHSPAELPHVIEALRRRIVELEERLIQGEHFIRALEERESYLSVLLDESSDPIFAFHLDGTYRYVNQAFADGVQKKREEIMGRRIWDIFSPEEAEKRYSALNWVFENGVTRVIEVRVPRTDGDQYYLTTIKPIKDAGGQVTAAICISKDITERKLMEEELRRLSTRDTLTGLYNRNFFELELERLQHSRHRPISILVADLDGLKRINDQEGHGAGDQALRNLAHIFGQVFRSEDYVARIGGDEFVVLMPGTTIDGAAAASERLRVKIQQSQPPLGLSIGVATEWEGCTLIEVFQLADERMYADKRRRKRFQERALYDT